ncbi:aluminum-activated malate transporter 10 [Phtheirospermum japonicum]|uniref:Aluminum-activated malate transporter 10 n=1 Tax=Phtheirospermum japonicum TaxID=374723 RepID=A0A830BL59_9LAMI|nr:aluminum-activated malate transporter 10 [Phtheirospermum japonicum]
MVKESEPCGRLEWQINMPDGTSKALVPECMSQNRIYRVTRRLVMGFISRIWGFLQKAWRLGVNEPKKVMHCFKVGMALSLVSLFYYMRPLYEGVGGNAMWAVMTVVVVFEYTVGATLSKCVNRAIGTLMAGALGVGVHWIASQSGERFEPIILQFSVFLLAAAATFSRFIPSIKERFDYGTMIFILTFSLVSVSGYRVEKLFELAHHRLSTIAIGTTICVLISMLFCPVWAGNELHNLIKTNIEKLSDSLDGCVADYFRDDVKANNTKSGEASSKMSHGYKCVLNSKATEESLVCSLLCVFTTKLELVKLGSKCLFIYKSQTRSRIRNLNHIVNFRFWLNYKELEVEVKHLKKHLKNYLHFIFPGEKLTITFFFFSTKPVSYTHLDVYKRQLYPQNYKILALCPTTPRRRNLERIFWWK